MPKYVNRLVTNPSGVKVNGLVPLDKWAKAYVKEHWPNLGYRPMPTEKNAKAGAIEGLDITKMAQPRGKVGAA